MDKALRLQVILSLADKALAPLKGISKGGQDATKQLRAARDAVRDLERTTSDLSSFKILKREVQQSSKALDVARDRATELGRGLAQVEKPTRAMSAEFRRARTDVARLERELHTKAATLRDVRNRLDAAGIGAGNLAAAERRLRAETAQANGELDRQQQRLAAIGDRQARMSAAQDRYSRAQAAAGNIAGAGVGAVAAGGAILAPAKSAYDKQAALQSTMTDIGQKADMTRKQAKAMQDQLVAMGPKVGQSAEDLAAGVDVLSGFGLSPGDATSIIGPIAKVSRAYKAEMRDISAASFSTHDNLKVPLADTARSLDIMAYAGKRGAFELKDMAQYFPQLTAASQGLGQSGVAGVADLAAALQITRKGAGDAASAATNLDNLLQKIAAPATVKKFGQMGVDLDKAMKQAQAAGKTPIEAIAEITNTTLKGDLSKIGYLFEDAQVQKALRPLIQNFEEYKAIRADALRASGVVDSDFAMRMQDDKEKTEASARALQALQLRLGAQLAPTIIKVAAIAGRLADRFSKWTADHPKLSAALAVSALVIGGLLVVFGGLALGVAAVLGPFGLMRLSFTAAAPVLMSVAKGVLFMSRAFIGLGASLLMNPITWIVLLIVAAVALLAGAAYLIYKNWGPISAWFAGVWEKIKTVGGAAIKAIAGFIMKFTPLGLFIRAFAAVWPFLSGLGGKFLSIGGQLIAGLVSGITNGFGALKNAITGMAGSAVSWIKKALGIRSPSRVFAGIGGYTMQGLALGIRKGQGAPLAAVRSASAAIAAAMAVNGGSVGAAAADASSRIERHVTIVASAAPPKRPPPPTPPGPGPGSAGGGDTHHWHIQQQPGQSAQDLAREIEKVLEQRDRVRAAKARSSFHDGED